MAFRATFLPRELVAFPYDPGQASASNSRRLFDFLPYNISLSTSSIIDHHSSQ